MVVVRFSASKVALVTGLHDFGDPAEELLNCVYQDRDELLAQDAARLGLRIVTKDEELETLVQKSGAAALQLRAAMRWAESATPVRMGAAKRVLEGVERRLKEAQSSSRMRKDEVVEARRLLAEKIYTSVGVRNEALALEAYERQTGSTVRLTNENFYFLTFPPLPEEEIEGAIKINRVDYSLLVQQCQREAVVAMQDRKSTMGGLAAREGGDVEEIEDVGAKQDEDNCPCGFFSICGMVDGVTDALTITPDDDWELLPTVVEVKNRVRGFRNPLPLYDQVQLAVYIKMLGFEQGDLVECVYGADSRPSIQVSRVELRSLSPDGTKDVWSDVIVPRLYAFTAIVQKLRGDELLRLAFINGTEQERRTMLRAECDFL